MGQSSVTGMRGRYVGILADAEVAALRRLACDDPDGAAAFRRTVVTVGHRVVTASPYAPAGRRPASTRSAGSRRPCASTIVVALRIGHRGCR
jgi:hypothetical protein